MNRRNFLKQCVFIAAAVGARSSVVNAGVKLDNNTLNLEVGRRRPNIIYILADDMGYGDLSCYGQTKFKTPNIDKLAAEGMVFTSHYTGSAVCAPSRCVLMTGLHTGHCQIRGNREVYPEGQAPMEAGTVAIPTLLKQAGYTSGMFGKWGLGAPGSVSDPMEFFDEFYGYNCQRQAHNYYPDHLWYNRDRVELDSQTYSHDLIMNAAKNFITTYQDRPFFCYLPVTIPHASMHAPEDLHTFFREQFPEFEDKIGVYSGPDVQNPIAAFAAMMTHLDNGVGEIMELLKSLGIDENTIVMLTSDNGPHVEGGHDPYFFDSNGPLRGIKRDLYEGGIRVPLIVRWPGKIKPATSSDHISGFQDVLPTCGELAGFDVPDGGDGISFLPTLLGKSGQQQQHPYLYWEFSGQQAVRIGKWKGYRKDVSTNSNPVLQLYDLETDTDESSNIAGSHPDIVVQIENIMNESHTPSPLFPLLYGE